MFLSLSLSLSLSFSGRVAVRIDTRRDVKRVPLSWPLVQHLVNCLSSFRATFASRCLWCHSCHTRVFLPHSMLVRRTRTLRACAICACTFNAWSLFDYASSVWFLNVSASAAGKLQKIQNSGGKWGGRSEEKRWIARTSATLKGCRLGDHVFDSCRSSSSERRSLRGYYNNNNDAVSTVRKTGGSHIGAESTGRGRSPPPPRPRPA